ncbi:hypothetical protein P3T76_013994 [Phytophthora citrophthora]|uniref:Uncharacterized protein n=1 Tax=Phytophthora citrophthora TaxID=4793 RepID=A0AAD9G360_9STRA|nr:hypothetical protein P3T76_013994 [Phytophthora citrophthora]
MEAVAKAMRRPDHDNSGDEESEVEAGKLDRKSSEASLLHRMAVADSKTIWKAELETNYEETDHPLSLVEGNEGNEQKTLVYTLAPGLSPVKRALPERKTKHKDLEERRQRGRQQRILIAQAAQEVNSLGFHGSVQPQDSYSTLVEESENDLSLEGSRRSSVVPVSTTEKQVPQPRASSAPRSSAVVGNAYALKNMPEMGTEEPEQFLRRKTLDAHRSVHVLKRDHWQSDIGMGIEITDERPSLETPPSRLDALLNTARRVMVVNAVGGSLQRSVTSLSDVGETRSSRISSSPSFFTAALSASHSEPILQRPPVEMKESFAASADQTLMEKPHGQMEIPNVPQLNIGAELNKKYSPRPLSKTVRAEVRSYPTLGLNLPMEDTSSSTLQRTRRRSAEDISIPMAMAQLKPQKQCAEVEDRMRSRSNSLGSEVIVRLAPLASTLKPLVQEFLATSEPESIVSISEPDVVQEEVCVSSPDPEVVIYPPVELPIETKEKIELVSGKESVDELSAPDLQEDNIQASENDDLHIVNNISSTAEEIQGAEPTAFHLGVPSDAELVVSPHQTARKECWEEPELSIVSPRIHDNAVEDSTVKKRLPETNEFQCENPVELPVSTKGPSSAEIAIAGSPSDLIEPQNEMSQQSNADYSGPLRYDNNEVQDDRGDEDETGTHFESTSFSEDSMYNCPDMPVIGEAEDGDEMDSFAGTIPIILAGVESIHSVDIASNDALDDIVPQDIHLDNDSDHDQPDNDQDTGNSSFLSAATNMNETNIIVLGSDEPSSVKMEVAHPQQAEELLTEVLTKNSVLLNEEGTSAKNRFQETYPMQEENHSEDSINFRQAAEEQQPRDKEVKISAKSKALAGVGLTNNAILKASTGPHRQLADPSPQRQKSGGSTRKKSLSPTKRYDPSSSMAQLKMSVKDVGSRRRSTVAKVANPLPLGKPKLERSHSAEDMKQEILGASRSASTNNPSSTLPDLPLASLKLSVKSSPQKSTGPILRSKSQDSAKRQSSQQSKAVQSVSNYHKKWGKWIAGKNLIEKVGCLQLEELVMADPQNEENLLKLGLRYARWSGTSMQAILLLEHAALLHKNVTGTREYWFWLGSAHLDIFMRHRKYLPVARFHLNRSIRAFTSAFAYMESLADPILLLRYAIGLFWHKGDGNLEKTRDIFHELFSRFVSFCDKDRPNLLFLQFQVLHRLKLYVDAIDCMNRIISLHESLPNQSSSTGAAPVLPSMNSVQHFAVYDAADYCLMLMQCQQASGDYVAAAQSLASVLKHESMQPLRDEEYFDLWFSLAEKCVLHEDYALALEYYAIALNFAKQSQALAAIHYNLGLCFQSLGEDSKCTTEYKRARTANRHVPPLVSLVELTTSYEERFAQLFQKSIVQTIEEVRVELYGRAVRRLQRVFRQSRRNLNINMNNSNSEASQMKMPSLSKRRLSVAAARNLPALVRIEDTGEETEAHEDESSPQQALPSDGNQNSKLDDIALEDVERRHESFLVRKQAAMEEMTALLASPQYRGREVSNTRFKAITQLRSGLLSPEKDQLDARRKQSMETYRQVRCNPIFIMVCNC